MALTMTQVITTTTHTPQCTTPTNFCASLIYPLRRAAYRTPPGATLWPSKMLQPQMQWQACGGRPAMTARPSCPSGAGRGHGGGRQPALHVEGGADQTVLRTSSDPGRGSSGGWWTITNLRTCMIRWQWQWRMAMRTMAKTTATTTTTGGPLLLGVIS